MTDNNNLNQVTIEFTNGDQLMVEELIRLVGAEWMTAEIAHPVDDPDSDDVTFEYIILRNEDIRYIRSERVSPASESGANFRVHHTQKFGSDKPGILMEAWMGQHQLHPDDDPSAFHGSEEQWPPKGSPYQPGGTPPRQ